MKKILAEINSLRRTKIEKLINRRAQEFKELGRKPKHDVFKELCLYLQVCKKIKG